LYFNYLVLILSFFDNFVREENSAFFFDFLLKHTHTTLNIANQNKGKLPDFNNNVMHQIDYAIFLENIELGKMINLFHEENIISLILEQYY